LTNRSGKLVVVNIATREIVTEVDLGGQPDSVRNSRDEEYATIAIENERNELLARRFSGWFGAWRKRTITFQVITGPET
jgi:hypothetical protein